MTVPAGLGTIGDFALLERLDPSGPGELYRARDTRRGRTVAVRLLPASHTPDAASSRALVEQARALLPLSHPNITTLFDAGEHAGRVYLAFEFLKGQSLRAEMAGRPLNVRRAFEIAIQMADAVADAHAAGFHHGGLSPDSVMITARGHAKIPTFHLASQVGFDPARGDATLQDYDSPEEARGEPPDDRSDVYSIAAVMYEMVTTRRPMHRGASAPSASNPRVPKELDAVLLKALSPNPASRCQSAALLAAQLRALLSGLDAGGGVLDEEEEPTPAGRSRTVVVLVAAGIVLAAAAAGWWLTQS